jgi:nifR3 family TIM-barrel protein
MRLVRRSGTVTARAAIAHLNLTNSTMRPLPETSAPPIPAFCVRDVPVQGDLILAPMAGFSDVPYRSICREYGSAMSYTEFASVEGVVWHSQRTRRILNYLPAERPVTFQIFGADEDALVASAQRIEEWGPDIIDVNLGCSTPKVSGRGAGAGLLREPAKIGRLFARLSDALHVPVTAKIRLGWDDDSRNYLEVARVLEDNGASLIAVHGRTRAQDYADPVDWDAIAEVKQSVKIPVLGNGGVMCAADIERIKRHTGCDGVMIGHGAMGHPWIFQRRDRDEIPFTEKTAMMRRHLMAMVDYYGEATGVVLFRKHAVRYLRGTPNITQLRIALLTHSRSLEVMQAIDAYEAHVCAVEAGEWQPRLDTWKLENCWLEE